MTDILYRWPEAAKFGRRVPKEKFYEHGTVSAAVREKFINEVQRVTWAYKLAEATINLPGTPTVPEIQVFTIDAKTDDVSQAVLGVIDKAILFPIIFEIARHCGEQSEVRTVAAHKQLGTGTPKLSAYYETGWKPGDTSRQTMPTAITLPALYAALLQPLTPITARPREGLADIADRLAAVRRLEREVASLERKLRNEPQLNRKVELRRALKVKQRELTVLAEG